jgi:streptomycin 6-kinase
VPILDHLQSHIAKWRLTLDGAPFETISSWLAYVTRDDERAVLKVFKPGSNEAPSARYLILHRANGTVRVLEGDERAILIERIAPGTPLASLSRTGRDDDATRIICDTIAKLQRHPVDIAGWPGHDEHLVAFVERRPVAPFTPGIVARAKAMFQELDASQPQRMLLHGDLHHDNILFDDELGWLAIDPKGEVGETAYEIAAALRNPLENSHLFITPQQLDRRVRIYCERLKLDRKRVLGWCFARNASAALWYCEMVPQAKQQKGWPSATLAAL